MAVNINNIFAGLVGFVLSTIASLMVGTFWFGFIDTWGVDAYGEALYKGGFIIFAIVAIVFLTIMLLLQDDPVG